MITKLRRLFAGQGGSTGLYSALGAPTCIRHGRDRRVVIGMKASLRTSQLSTINYSLIDSVLVFTLLQLALDVVELLLHFLQVVD